MAKYILIRLIDGTEYYVNPKKEVIGKMEGLTGKTTNIEPSSDWKIDGFWYKKMLGRKETVDLFQFLTDVELGQVKYQDKKENWKYGVAEVHHGRDLFLEPLSDFGVTFVQLRED